MCIYNVMFDQLPQKRGSPPNQFTQTTPQAGAKGKKKSTILININFITVKKN